MSIDAIVQKISGNYPHLVREEVRALATDIHYSGEQPEVILANEDVMDKLIHNFRNRHKPKRALADNDRECPICKLPLKAVLLADDRPASFCPKHFVVFPVKKEAK